MTLALSIVVPCHNKREALKLTLESLCRQTFPAEQFEVLVVDQVSDDGSRDLVRSFQAPFTLRLIEQDGLYGISVSRNEGVEAADSSIIVFLDADLIASPELVAAYIDCHHANPGALVCGRLLPYLPAYTRFYETVANPEAGLDRGTDQGPIPFYRAFGGNLSLSADTFQKIGPYDQQFKRFQDIEYSCRADLLGIPIIYCPKAASYHNHPRSLKQRLEHAQNNWMVPILLNRYPYLKGAMHDLRHFEPIDWRQDDLRYIRIKFTVWIYSLALIRGLFFRLLNTFDHYRLFPSLIRFLYWRLYIGYGRVGYQQGLQRLGRVSTI